MHYIQLFSRWNLDNALLSLAKDLLTALWTLHLLQVKIQLQYASMQVITQKKSIFLKNNYNY